MQLKYLYCGGNQEKYADFPISPAGRIDRELIVSEKDNDVPIWT
ncbi:MAG: hypothetical protein ACP5SH_27630 [Syntrophobacteraceae bacterium]